MFLIPIGLDQTTVRRLPWVSIAIIVANVVAFVAIGASSSRVEEEANTKAREALAFWQKHPYLAFPEKLLSDRTPAERRQFLVLTEVMKTVGPARPENPDQVEREQHELDRMMNEIQETIQHHPNLRWGLVPAHPRPVTFLTSLFMHAGWLHLLGNMLIFYITGPFVEDAFGRPLFAALYLASGVVASLAHIAAFPHTSAPLVGASGAIAGIMGAFLVRFARAKVRFFWVFWLFLLARYGTFAVPAWIVLPLWLLQNLFFAGLSSQAGVAYWAHVGGFLFGFVAAVGIKALRIEEKYIAPKIEEELTITQHPELERGMAGLSRGNLAGAREALERVVAAEPRNPDAQLGLWQCAVAEGKPAAGAGNMAKVIEDELRRGEIALAFDHWQEMLKAAGSGGPAPVRWRLAAALEASAPGSAAEVFRHLAGDPSAGLLGEKAARRLGTEAGISPAKPTTPTLAAVAPSNGPGLARAVPAPDAVATEAAGKPADPHGAAYLVEICRPERILADGVLLRGDIGAAEMLPFSQIETITVGGISGAGRPYLLLDLVLRQVPGETSKVIRFVSSSFDPRALVGVADQPPLEAFREMVRVIAAGSAARVVPPGVATSGGRISSFASPELYEQKVLAPQVSA
ncbi:MAG: rhomboid family intramembrane serine protease [Thermoanaerobaculales bacterium]